MLGLITILLNHYNFTLASLLLPWQAPFSSWCGSQTTTTQGFLTYQTVTAQKSGLGGICIDKLHHPSVRSSLLPLTCPFSSIYIRPLVWHEYNVWVKLDAITVNCFKAFGIPINPPLSMSTQPASQQSTHKGAAALGPDIYQNYQAHGVCRAPVSPATPPAPRSHPCLHPHSTIYGPCPGPAR